MSIDPSKDGVDHINVYSKGATELGRFLSNFAYCSVVAPEGTFESVEGYWYYLLCRDLGEDLMWRKGSLKKLHGYRAKKVGESLLREDKDAVTGTQEFQDKIKAAITSKLEGNSRMLEMLQRNSLPLKHYYVYGGRVVDRSHRHVWQLDHLKSFCKGQSDE